MNYDKFAKLRVRDDSDVV